MRSPNVNPWVVAFVLVVTVVVIALAWIWAGIFKGHADAAATGSCPSIGYVCGYSGKDYNGAVGRFDTAYARGGFFPALEGRSIRNHFGDRSVRYWHQFLPDYVGCVRPQGAKPAVNFTQLDISPRGAGCSGGWGRRQLEGGA